MKTLTIASALSQRIAAVPYGWPSPNLTAQPGMFVKKLITDFHGPIADFIGPASQFAKGTIKGANPQADKVKYYNACYDANFGVTPKQWMNLFPQFARLGRGGYGDLPIRAGVVDQYKAIRDAGIPIEIWTWCPGASEHLHGNDKAVGTGIAQSATYELISTLGIVDNVEKQVQFVTPSAKPGNMAEQHLPLIIEDNPATAITVGTCYGAAAILTPEPYTQNIVAPGVLCINDMSELSTAVIDFFQKLEEAGALAP